MEMNPETTAAPEDVFVLDLAPLFLVADPFEDMRLPEDPDAPTTMVAAAGEEIVLDAFVLPAMIEIGWEESAQEIVVAEESWPAATYIGGALYYIPDGMSVDEFMIQLESGFG